MRRELTATWSTDWIGEGYRIETLRGRFRPAGWSDQEVATRWAIVFVRRGAYRRRADGVEYIVDRNTGFVRRPGEEWSSAVFTTAYEELTVLEVDPDCLGHLPELTDAAGPVPVQPDVALAHRLLVRALHGDELQVEEGVFDLAHRFVPAPACRRPIGRRPSTATTRRQLVADCVELLNTSYHEPVGLLDLARRVGSSPYHLSRVFREVTGTTISQYRTRLRLQAVLERLDEGDDDLATVAAATGFADHGHMTRTVTGLLGVAPSVLRSRLRPRGDGVGGEVVVRSA
jgi:AraC-like DNA-binding protein